MSFLDDLEKELTRAGKDVMKGTRKTVDRVKVTAQIAEQERKLEKLYTDLGRAVYAADGKLDHKEYLELAEPIDLVFDLLEQLDEEAQRLSGMDHCASCGAKLSNGAAFCSACGEAVFRCEECGKIIDRQSIFCNYCGHKVDD